MSAGHSIWLLLILALVVAFFAVRAAREDAPQPHLPLVNASGCEPVNPCLTQSCEPPKGPFGGVDPDAGERDQRRIS